MVSPALVLVFPAISPFFVFSPPPTTLTLRRRILVCLTIVPFSSRLPRHMPTTPAVRGRFLMDGSPYYSVCVPFTYASSRFPDFIARPFRSVGVGLRRRIFDAWSSWWNRDFPEFIKFLHIMRLIRVG